MTNYLETRQTCPICGSNQLTHAFDASYWRENPLRYFDCRSCKATFANPMPSNDLISRGNDALVRLYQEDRSPNQEFREGRQAYLRGKLLARKLSRWKRKGRLLELGCFHGFFSLGVKENSDWEVEGLEISSELCSFVKNSLGFHCYEGTLEEADLPTGKFDFVVCHDLIEHINRPQVFLRKLSSILSVGGRVQIITPNGKQDLAYSRRAYSAGIPVTFLLNHIPVTFLLNHILYFRTETLRQALQNVGLKPVKFYCYDVRHAMKDFGCFGLGKPVGGGPAPSMDEILRQEKKAAPSIWTPAKIQELRRHKKTSLAYGFVKEVLPQSLRLKVPPSLEVGHEIYALAQK